MSPLLQLGPPVGLLALGALLLLWGADEFMDHVDDVARLAGVPVLVVGLLAAGAEPEELTTAIVAAASNEGYLAVGDVIGANVAMMALGLGVAFVVGGPALFGSVRVEAPLRRVAVAAAACGAGAVVALLDGVVTRWEGAVLIGAYAAFVTWVWHSGRVAAPRMSSVVVGSRWRVVGACAVGLAAMAVGGALAVDGASQVASVSGWGERATGLTVLGLATSIEAFALAAAARRRELTSVAVAGLLGSVAFNATGTLGAAALVAPLDVPGVLPGAVVAALLPLAVLLAYRGRVVRPLGVALAASYVMFAAWAAGAFS